MDSTKPTPKLSETELRQKLSDEIKSKAKEFLLTKWFDADGKVKDRAIFRMEFLSNPVDTVDEYLDPMIKKNPFIKFISVFNGSYKPLSKKHCTIRVNRDDNIVPKSFIDLRLQMNPEKRKNMIAEFFPNHSDLNVKETFAKIRFTTKKPNEFKNELNQLIDIGFQMIGLGYKEVFGIDISAFDDHVVISINPNLPFIQIVNLIMENLSEYSSDAILDLDLLLEFENSFSTLKDIIRDEHIIKKIIKGTSVSIDATSNLPFSFAECVEKYELENFKPILMAIAAALSLNIKIDINADEKQYDENIWSNIPNIMVQSLLIQASAMANMAEQMKEGMPGANNAWELLGLMEEDFEICANLPLATLRLKMKSQGFFELWDAIKEIGNIFEGNY